MKREFVNIDELAAILAQPNNPGPSSPQMIMGEAIEHLQGRQKEAYILAYREDKSFADIANILGVSKSTVQVYITRAVAFISAYCKQAIKAGRV